MRHLLLVAASTCAALLIGCPVSGDRSCEELANCPDDGSDASPDAGSTPHPDASTDGTTQGDATTDADAGPPACNTALDPKAAPCVVDDTLGVFVAPTGSDTTGNGTKAKPYATLTKAVASPKPGMLRAFVCAGTYKDAAVVTAAADGMAIYGGLDCTTWAYDAANKVAVAPTAHGPALSVTGVATGLTIEDVEFDAQAGTAAGESSIAGVVSGATGVVLRRVRLVAGAGVAGAAGTVPSTPLPKAIDGQDASSGTAGGGPQPCPCPFGPPSVGGAGGAASTPLTDGELGAPIRAANKGVSAPTTCTAGGDGTPGAAISPDGAGAKTPAAVTGATWVPTSGTKGTPGETGQGGGGGGAIADAGNGGGGGGCGGCGGDGGGFGAGGGSSVALLAVTAPRLSVADAVLVASSAGTGGAGAKGQAGADRAAKGNASKFGRGCNGGSGGVGGQGGSGGGGAGGVSVGIAYKGSDAPTLDALTTAGIVTGSPGTGGTGGNPGVNDGLAGVKKDVLAL